MKKSIVKVLFKNENGMLNFKYYHGYKINDDISIYYESKLWIIVDNKIGLKISYEEYKKDKVIEICESESMKQHIESIRNKPKYKRRLEIGLNEYVKEFNKEQLKYI